MAIVRIQRPAGVTFEMYTAVNAKVGVESDPPAGLILHSAGEVDGVLQIVDVWESEEAARRFGDERLLPAIKEVAGDRAPTGAPEDATTYELKNLVTP
jgi:hypothetical protein